MSVDTYLLARTPLSAEEVKAALARAPELADLGLADYGREDGLGGDRVTLVARPWDPSDEDALLEHGFGDPTVSMTLIPGHGREGYAATDRVLASLLRLVPGDVCAELEGGGPLALLRLGGTVYVDPDRITPGNLSRYGYAPERLVIGPVPSQAAAVGAVAA